VGGPNGQEAPIRTRLRLLAAGLLAAAALAEAAPATAQEDPPTIVSDVSGAELENILQISGFSAQLTADEGGNPALLAEVDSVRFIVRTFGCSDAEAPRCDQLMFFANFDLGREVTEDDFRTINNYNDSNVFGRGYVLENSGRVGVDLVVNLRGGVTVEHFIENLRVWIAVLEAFAEELNARPVVS